jgi:hypothetical protein
MSRARLAAGVPVALAVSRWRFSKLRRVDPRPFGLAVVPPLWPVMLSSEGRGPGLTAMSLSYGRPLAVSGQLIEVATCFSEPDCELPPVREAIARAQQRDAAWAREDWENAPEMSGPEPFEVPVPAAGFHRQERPVIVAGQERVMAVMSRDGYEGVRFRHGSTQAARGIKRWVCERHPAASGPARLTFEFKGERVEFAVDSETDVALIARILEDIMLTASERRLPDDQIDGLTI